MSKVTTTKTASLAAKTLRSPTASKRQKTLAASVLSQSKTKKVTSERVEKVASNALRSKTSAVLTKKLAGRSGYRLKVGQYRVLYDLDKKKKLITILSCQHRKDAYRLN